MSCMRPINCLMFNYKLLVGLRVSTKIQHEKRVFKLQNMGLIWVKLENGSTCENRSRNKNQWFGICIA